MSQEDFGGNGECTGRQKLYRYIFFFLQQAKNAELYMYLYPGLLQALKRKSLTVAVLVAGEERLYTYSDLLQAWAREPFIVAFPAAGEDSELYVYLYHDLLQA